MRMLFSLHYTLCNDSQAANRTIYVVCVYPHNMCMYFYDKKTLHVSRNT